MCFSSHFHRTPCPARRPLTRLSFCRSSGYNEFKPALDNFYLGVSALFAIPLQAIFFAAAVAFNEPAVCVGEPSSSPARCFLLTSRLASQSASRRGDDLHRAHRARLLPGLERLVRHPQHPRRVRPSLPPRQRPRDDGADPHASPQRSRRPVGTPPVHLQHRAHVRGEEARQLRSSKGASSRSSALGPLPRRRPDVLLPQQRPVRLPLGIIVSYLLFPWVLFLPYILSCSPHISYSGYGGYVRFKPYPSVRSLLLS